MHANKIKRFHETQKIKAITVCIYYPAIQAMAGWNPDSQR